MHCLVHGGPPVNVSPYPLLPPARPWFTERLCLLSSFILSAPEFHSWTSKCRRNQAPRMDQGWTVLRSLCLPYRGDGIPAHSCGASVLGDDFSPLRSHKHSLYVSKRKRLRENSCRARKSQLLAEVLGGCLPGRASLALSAPTPPTGFCLSPSRPYLLVSLPY